MIRSILSVSLLLLSVSVSAAGGARLGDLHVTNAWSRALPPIASTGAAYFTIDNRGSQPERLMGVMTPIARRAEIHEHAHADGVMRMQRVESVVIAPGAAVSFAPGKHHVMLFDLQQPLVAGVRYPLTLQFERAGELEVAVEILDDAPASQHGEPPAEAHHHH